MVSVRTLSAIPLIGGVPASNGGGDDGFSDGDVLNAGAAATDHSATDTYSGGAAGTDHSSTDTINGGAA